MEHVEPKLKFKQFLIKIDVYTSGQPKQLSEELSVLQVIPQSGKVYRLLRPDENPEDGIKSKDPDSKVKASFHVAWGSSEKKLNSKYISTCLNYDDVEAISKKNRCLNGDIVCIDINNAPVTEIIHVWDENVRRHLQKVEDVCNHDTINTQDTFKKCQYFANANNEVLLVGVVPADCVTVEKKKQFLPNYYDKVANN